MDDPSVQPDMQLDTPAEVPQSLPPQPVAPSSVPTNISKANPFFLVNPDDGKSYPVYAGDTANSLLQSGWSPETKDQFVDRNVRGVVREHPIASSIVAFAGQAFNQAGLGIPQLIEEHSGSKDDQARTQSINRAITGEHPNLNIAGGGFGLGATLLAGPAGEALGYLGDSAVQGVKNAAALGGEKLASLASSKLASTAVKYGVENAAFNVPYRVTEDMLGDPNIANEGILAHGAEDFALGAGLGLGTGLLGSVIKGAAGVASGVLTPEYLQEKANLFQLKNTGALTSELNKLGQVTGKTFQGDRLQTIIDTLDANVSKTDQLKGPGAILNAALKSQQGIGEKLTGIRALSDSLEPGAIGYEDVAGGIKSVRDEYTKGNISTPDVTTQTTLPGPTDTTSLWKQAAQHFGNDMTLWPPEVTDAIYNNAPLPGGTVTQAGVNITDPTRTADVKAIDFFKSAFDAFASRKMTGLGMSDQQIVEALQTGEGLPQFGLEELHQFRQTVKDTLFQVERANGIITNGGKDVWNGIGSLMDNTISRIGEETNNPELIKAFSETNAQWKDVNNLTKQVLRSAANRAAARNNLGLGTTILTAAGHAGSGNVGALAGLTTGLIKQHFGNYLMYQTMGTAAKVLEGIQGTIGDSIGEAISGTRVEAAKVGSVGILSRYTGDEKATPKENLAKFTNDLALAQSNPDTFASALDAVAPGMNQFAPQNYALMGATAQRGIHYLQQTAPKPPNPVFPGGPTPTWTPGDNDLSKYSRRVDAVFNPLGILKQIKNGTLTAEGVDAVKTVYPNLYGAIQQEVQKRLASAPANQVYKIRNKLSLILDGMDDPTVKAQKIQLFQSSYLKDTSKVKPLANSKIDEAGRTETPLDKALR